MKIILTYIFLVLSTCIWAQSEAISTAGGSSASSKHKVHWSIGNTVAGSSRSNSYIVNAGISVGVYTIMYEEENTLKINCYPNPTIGSIIKLHIYTNKYEGYSWEIITLQGVRIESGSINSDITPIKIDQLRSEVYLLNVLDENLKIVATGKFSKK